MAERSLPESIFGDLLDYLKSSNRLTKFSQSNGTTNTVQATNGQWENLGLARILHLVDGIVATRTQAKLPRNIHRLVSIVGKLLVS